MRNHVQSIYLKLGRLALAVGLLILLASCASTTAPPTEAGRIAEAMRDQGVELANVRAVAVPPQRTRSIVEDKGFDIPGIDTDDKPAGTIRIFKGTKEADADRRLYSMLGEPGPQTKLDYVTVSGTRGLILDHRLPKEVADRYIDAFTNSQ